MAIEADAPLAVVSTFNPDTVHPDSWIRPVFYTQSGLNLLGFSDPKLDKDENKCQQTILKEVWKFYQTKSKLLQKCWDKRLLGKHSDDCPDAGAATGSEAQKAAEKLAKAESKKVAKICKKCGGDDKLCGGPAPVPADLSPLSAAHAGQMWRVWAGDERGLPTEPQ